MIATSSDNKCGMILFFFVFPSFFFKELLGTHVFLYIVVLGETARAVTPSQTNSGLKIGICLDVGGANIVSAVQ